MQLYEIYRGCNVDLKVHNVRAGWYNAYFIGFKVELLSKLNMKYHRESDS